MKKLLPTAPSTIVLLKKGLWSATLWFALLVGIAATQTTTAQCIGPYKVFESFKNSLPTATFGFTGTPSFSLNSTGAARNGTYCLQHTSMNADAKVTTPDVTNVSTFSFWIKKTGPNVISFSLEFSPDSGVNFYTIVNGPNNLAGYSINATLPTIPVAATTGTYQFVTVTFNTAIATSRFRISDVRGAVAGSIFLDDFAWTSSVASENTIVVPDLGTTTACTAITVPPSGTGILTFYDQGGLSDTYSKTQTQTWQFAPATPGEKVKITFQNSFALDAASNITAYNGSGTATVFPLTPPFPYTSVSTLPPTTVFTSTDATGYVTVKFVTAAGVPLAGFDIKVECVACVAPSGLAFAAAGGVSHNSAYLTWSGSTANYDMFYNTTGVAPATGSAANGGSSATTSGTVSGLSASTLYYFWVRGNCGLGGLSTWLGPISSTTLCTPQTVTYFENFNGYVGGVLPTCTSVSTAGSWTTNPTNGNLFGNAIGTSFFTQGVTLTAGQLYRVSYDYSSNGNGNADLILTYGHPANNVAATQSNTPNPLAYTPFIANTTAINNIVNFTATVSGTYYLQFSLDNLSVPASGALNIDNIKIEIETCLPPTFAAASPVAPAQSTSPEVTALTDFGATVSWITPTTGNPTNGYFYFVNTTNTPPNFSDIATGATGFLQNSVTLSTLSPNTRYYVWVRANCGGQISAWSLNYVTFVTTNLSAPVLVQISDSTSPFNVTCGQNITFTDSNFNTTSGSGFAIGDYNNNEKAAAGYTPFTYTFIPTTAGAKLKVIFNSFRTENQYDGLLIYSGTSAAGTLMSSGRAAGFNPNTDPAGAFSGTISPGTILSTAADGSLTFVFRSDFSVVYAGWTAAITCVTNPPSITSFTPTNNSCGSTPSIVITGINLGGATSVTVGGAPATITANTATSITVNFPSGASTGKITVTTPQATATSVADFTIQNAPPVSAGTTICANGASTITSTASCDIAGLTTFTGTLTGSSPLAPKPSGSGTTCSFTGGNNYYYTATQITVSVTGSYTFQTTSSPSVDLMAYITSGTFTPGSCATGTFIRSDDDAAGGLQPSLTVTLNAGTVYTLYTTTYGALTTANYTWNITPPVGGSIALYQAGQVQWYTAAVGGSAIGTGSPFNPVGVAGSGLANTSTAGTTVFYAACSSNPTCRTATNFVINARPTVTFTVQPGATACTNNDVTYTTQAGQTGYTWSVPGILNTDYTITTGGTSATSSTVTLQWLTTGTKTVTINYNNASSCSAIAATSSTATNVSASAPTTVTPGSASVCANVVQTLTASSASATFFSWTTSAGALFTDAAGTIPYVALTNSAVIYFKGNANAIVTVGGTGCAAPNTAAITINKVLWNGTTWSNANVGPDATVSAEFQGNFTSSINASGSVGNIAACSVVVTSGNVLFDKGTLTVQNAVAVNGGSLIFDDTGFDVSLYQVANVANAVGVYAGGNTGNITFKRTAAPMYRLDYTYWSTPVNPQNLLAVSPLSPLGLFLEYTTGWNYIASPSTTTMVVGKGYIIRAPTTFNSVTTTSYTAPFAGVPNNGDLSVPIIGGAGQFNFIGNPYPSSLFANDFINGNANVSGTLYFWTHNTPINGSGQYALNGDYSSYNLSGGLASTNTGSGNITIPTGYVASGQGFFVKGLTTSPAVFTNDMRKAGNNKNFYRTTANANQDDLERHRYWLNITNTEGAFKQALVAYVATASLGLDRLFDGELVESSNVIALYTKVDQTRLSIQGRPLPFAIADTVPLCIKSTIASTYTITMPQYDGLFTEQHVYLEDRVLNVIHDLRDSPYTFATAIGTFEDRFVLRYTNQALGIAPVFNENSVVVYKNEQGLFINTGQEIMKTVTIYDVLGRQIAVQKLINSTATRFTNLPTTQQVLLVKIESENGITVTKKVLY